MKKTKILPLLLSLILLAGILPGQALAAETTQSTQQTITVNVDEAAVAEPTEVPFGQVSIQEGCNTINAQIPLGGSEPMLDSAQAVFLYESNTDTTIYSYNADVAVAPGSLAKIVTGIVALQYCDLDDIVTVAEGIKSRLPVSTLTLGLTNNEQISVRDLLYALILTDANDAAVALAEHIAGNRQSFVPLMNAWVESIGCTNTEFGTVHGVDGNASHTCARDIVKIVVEATKNEEFNEIFCTASYTVEPTNVNTEKRELDTMNYLRDDSNNVQFYQTRVTGGLASYEETSGACLVVTAEQNNMRLIGVVMGCTRIFAENGWQPVTYGNFEDMVDLLKYGFDNYKVNRIVYSGATLTQFSVIGGESNAAGTAKVDIDSVVPATAQMKNLTVNYNMEENLTAPIHEGDLIATMELWYRNSCLAEAEVYAMGDVKESDKTGVVIHSVAEEANSGGTSVLGTIGTICVIVLGLVALYLGVNAFLRARRRARHRRRRAERRRTN